MVRFARLSFVAMSLCALFTVTAAGQEAAPKVLKGGVVNGKAVSLPKPEYPDALRQAGIGGIVAVDIIVDETGAVVSAQAVQEDQRQMEKTDGGTPMIVDPLLRAAAEEAALKAKFAPTRLSGQPVRISGKVIYNFVPNGAGDEGATLNGKATSLPAPAYPAAAKAVGAHGTVNVRVEVNEEGSVLSATAVSGHPLLRAAAVAAALNARFSPAVVNNQPVRVSGVLTYNFVLDEKIDQ